MKPGLPSIAFTLAVAASGCKTTSASLPSNANGGSSQTGQRIDSASSSVNLTKINRLEKINFFVEVANLAYLDTNIANSGTHSASVEEFQKKFGVTIQEFHSLGAAAMIISNEQNAIVVFRGTMPPNTIEGIRGWMTNMQSTGTLGTGRSQTDFAAAGVGAFFHSGFVQVLEALNSDGLLKAMESYNKSFPDGKIYIAGHSQGGAFAQLFAWTLNRRFIPVEQILTFSSPKIGNCAAVHSIETTFQGRLLRFYRRADPVPRLPADPTYCRGTNELEFTVDTLQKLIKYSPVEVSAFKNDLSDVDLLSVSFAEHSIRIYNDIIISNAAQLQQSQRDADNNKH